MPKHWTTSDGYYLCIRACGIPLNNEKVANALDEVTCKNCLRKIKKVEIPVDVFKVFIRFGKGAGCATIRNVIRSVLNQKSSKILFLPNSVEVLVVNNKGEAKVL